MNCPAPSPDRDRLAGAVLEAISTTRSIHRYLPDAVPEDDLAQILYAASRAPSGANAQPARWLVLRGGEPAGAARHMLGESFRAAWADKARRERWWEQGPDDRGTRRLRTARSMQRFVDSFEAIPVIVLACLLRDRPRYEAEGASIYPGCQNLLLAARSLGYGGTMSTWHTGCEPALRSLLGVPDEVFIAATIALGRPAGAHGPLRRLPIGAVVFDGAWGRSADWVTDPVDARLSRITTS